MYIRTLWLNRLLLQPKICHFLYVQSSVWKWARDDGIWLCPGRSVILCHQLSPLDIFGQPTARGICQYCVHTDNPFPMAKISIIIIQNYSQGTLRALTWYPPLTVSSLGFSTSLQMLNSTLPIPLPTTPVSPSDSTTVWTQFEIESEKKVVNKSGKPNAHKPTFNPIIMYLKCSSQWRIL